MGRCKGKTSFWVFPVNVDGLEERSGCMSINVEWGHELIVYDWVFFFTQSLCFHPPWGSLHGSNFWGTAHADSCKLVAVSELRLHHGIVFCFADRKLLCCVRVMHGIMMPSSTHLVGLRSRMFETVTWICCIKVVCTCTDSYLSPQPECVIL